MIGRALVLVGVLATASAAEASCAGWDGELTPPGGNVPAKPVLYFAAPKGAELELEVSAPHAKTKLGSSHGADVYSIAVDLTRGPFTVKSRTCHAVKGAAPYCSAWLTSQFDAGVSAGAGGKAVTVESVDEHVSDFVCTGWRYQAVKLSMAVPAVRVLWSKDRRDVEAGKGNVSYLTVGGTEAAFGHLGCTATTFDWAASDVWVRLQPLHTDGSMSPATEAVLLDVPANHDDLLVQARGALRRLVP